MYRLDHVALQVSDMERSITFYEKKLGLKLLSRQIDEAQHEEFAFLELEGGNLELLCMLGENNQPLPYEAPEPAAPWCPHLAIAVPDIASQLMRVEREKISMLKEPVEIAGQVRWFYCCDPDNNIIEFVQWLDTPGTLKAGPED
jgi:lactoylglutathione lyase